jgi:RNA polymerase sigma factor (sigma-70 family)
LNFEIGTGGGMVEDFERAKLTQSLRKVAQGDRGALREVYQRTSSKLFGVALRILNDRQEAEDVLQDVYLTVWRRAETFDPAKASPITWLVSIARNRSIDRMRAGGGRVMTDIDEAVGLADPTPDAAAQVVANAEHAQLNSCIEALDPKHAAAVRTAFFEGLTYDALARLAGVPLGTMKGWIRRSLMSLRSCLEGA